MPRLDKKSDGLQFCSKYALERRLLEYRRTTSGPISLSVACLLNAVSLRPLIRDVIIGQLQRVEVLACRIRESQRFDSLIEDM